MLGLYLHLPFCIRKCDYCDFNSKPAAPGEVDVYLEALLQELRDLAGMHGRAADTLYLGGGTPTVLSGDQFRRLFGVLERLGLWTPGLETTVEANPGTLDRPKAQLLAALGVNRISLGVQALQDRLLRRLGRMHTGRAARDTFDTLRAVGFENIGIDLIYGLPEQHVADWVADLGQILDLGPEHLSLYGLMIEGGTPFARQREQGVLLLPSEEEEIAMLRSAREMTAAAGYEHYEISNYARPGFPCRHNLGYWTVEEYIGAGAGAHSFLQTDGPTRSHNTPAVDLYIERMREGRSPVFRTERLSPRTLAAEALMLGLRMREGVPLEAFRSRYGIDPFDVYAACLRRGLDNSWLEIEGGRLRFTETGMLLSNEFFVDLF